MGALMGGTDRADMERIDEQRAQKPTDTIPPETLLLGLTRTEAENLLTLVRGGKVEPGALDSVERSLEALLA